jgi:hypothetical protein
VPCWSRDDIIWAESLKEGEGFVAIMEPNKTYKVIKIEGDDVRAIDRYGHEVNWHVQTDVIRAERCHECRQIKLTGIKS